MIAALLAATLAVTASAAAQPAALGAAALWTDPGIDWAAINIVDYITPAPADAPADVPQIELDGCVSSNINSALNPCSEGDPDGPLVIIAGDSKTFQWHPAISLIAADGGWRLTTLAFSACPITLSGVPLNGEAYASCEAWIPQAVDYILDAKPDLLIVSGGRGVAYSIGGDPTDQTAEALIDGYARAWQLFVDAGIPVVVIVDNPAPPVEMWECADLHRDALSNCSFPIAPDSIRTIVTAQLEAAARVPEVATVRFDEWLCPGRGPCPAVIGNVMVYRRQSHLTATYVASMAPVVSSALHAATGGRFGDAHGLGVG